MPLSMLNRHGLVAGGGRGVAHAAEAGGAVAAVGSFLHSPMGKSLTRSVGSSLGRELTRSLFGTSRRRR